MKKTKRFRVFFTIKGVVEVEAKTKQEADEMVCVDPLGICRGDYDFDTKVEEVKDHA